MRAAKGVQVGAGGTQTNHFGGRAPVTWPCRVGVVPAQLPYRQGRPADDDLAAALGTPGSVVLGQVLSGLGGVGKTQLAAGLAHDWWQRQRLDLLVWITAGARSGIVTGYAEAAVKVTGLDDPDSEQGAARFLAWLAEPHDRLWLVVLDDVADPNDLTGLWPPTTVHGRTLITSRRRDRALLDGRQVIDVDVFTPRQAAAYLRAKLADVPQRLGEVDELAADLGHLPLALAQAVAFIADRGARMTCAAYRRLLADQRRQLRELAPDALPDQHRATVAATWSLSVDRADTLAPAGVARPVLELAALLDPNAVPADLFSTGAVAGYVGDRLGRDLDAQHLDDALHLLHRFNLVSVDDATGSVRVHGLVQRAVRDATDPGRRPALARAAADALLELWPEVERDTGPARTLRANAAALRATTGPDLWTGGAIHQVLFRATLSLGEAGQLDAAIGELDRLHADCLPALGPDHADVLIVRNNLAWWRGVAGDHAGAAAALRGLLADRVRVLGPDAVNTLATRHNLAAWQAKAGDVAGAVRILEQLLPDELRVLGPDDRDTLNTRKLLADLRGDAGDAAGAVAALEGLVADCVRVLGPDHPRVLHARLSLAGWRGAAGDADGAVAAFAQLVTDHVRVLGPDHPDTLGTRSLLAGWRGRAGDRAGAADAFQELLDDRRRVLGPDHPDTLDTLARLRGVLGGVSGGGAGVAGQGERDGGGGL